MIQETAEQQARRAVAAEAEVAQDARRKAEQERQHRLAKETAAEAPRLAEESARILAQGDWQQRLADEASAAGAKRGDTEGSVAMEEIKEQAGKIDRKRKLSSWAATRNAEEATAAKAPDAIKGERITLCLVPQEHNRTRARLLLRRQQAARQM